MKSLDDMCAILNRWLDLDPEAAFKMLGVEIPCNPTTWPKMLDDKDLIVHVKPEGMVVTPLSLINSLVTETREDGEYAIYRDVDAESGETTCFFVAKVSRS